MPPRDLADALEGRREGHEWRCRCPVHGGRSLSITKRDGRLLMICRAGCPQSEVVSALKRLGLWEGVTSDESTPPPEPEPANDTDRRGDRASEIWNHAHPIQNGDSAQKYLTGRGIVLDAWPEDLHSHPALPYWTQDDNGKPVLLGKWPAMIAIVRNPQGRPVALHRTYITSDGTKAPVPAPKKIMKIYDLSGSSVRLFPPRDGLLAVCEGIEDALSAWILWQIPAWAVLGTSGMKAFQPPEVVRELLIFADRDEHGAGQTAALKLGDRLKEKGVAVRIRVPSGHKDLNQLLMESTR